MILVAAADDNLDLLVSAQEDTSADGDPHDTGSDTREQGPGTLLSQNTLKCRSDS